MSLPHRRPAALIGAIFLALALLLPQAPAQAALVTYSLTLPSAATKNLEATSTNSVSLKENVSGDFAVLGRSPWDAPNSPTTDFTDPAWYFSTLYQGTATFDFGGSFDRLSLVWGTPGPTNILKLLLNGVQVFSIDGQTVRTNASFPAPGDAEKSVLLTISDLRFDQMVISVTGRPAFEFANLNATLPIPMAGLLLLSAIICMAAIRRRKAA